MQAVPGVPQAAGMGQFLELFKMQFLMKMMNGDGRQTTAGSLWTMVVLFFWDQFAKSAPAMFALAYAYIQRTYFPDQKAIKDMPLMSSPQPPPPQKTVRACIQFERTVDTKAVDPRIEAVMHHVCTLPDVRSLRYNGVEMIPNFKDMIMIDNDIWFEILNPQLSPIVTGGAGGQAPKQEPILYRLSTYDHDITWLHKFVEQAMERFEQEKKNKLGSESYYFDHITGVAGPYRNPLSPAHCTFSKSKFQSNRVLNNVYLRQIDELAERVQFFMRRRDWYDAKGIPHTLGIVMYGHPGCGKTSTIKAIANETKRHIFNISLGAIKTKEAIKDLFYNDNVNILQDGKMEMLNIPIKQRVYVIEDIDAMDSVVIKRSAEDTEKEKERKLKLDAEVEWLKQTQGKDVAQRMVQGKEEKDEDKLDLATLLNVLDGVRETPGRIIILSTNYPERLDEALLRPGRFDMMLEFEKHSTQVLKLHLERHYDTKLTEKQWKRINIPALHFKWTPAEVSQILFRRVGNVDLAIDDLVKEDPKQLFKFSQLSKEQKASEEAKPTQEDTEGTDLTALLEIEDKVPVAQASEKLILDENKPIGFARSELLTATSSAPIRLFANVDLLPNPDEPFTQQQITVAQETLQKLSSLFNDEYAKTERKLASTSMDETMRNALTRYKEYMTTLSTTLQSKDLIHPVRNLLTYKEDLKTFLKAVSMNKVPGQPSLPLTEGALNRVLYDNFREQYTESEDEDYFVSGGSVMTVEPPTAEQQAAREKWLAAVKTMEHTVPSGVEADSTDGSITDINTKRLLANGISQEAIAGLNTFAQDTQLHLNLLGKAEDAFFQGFLQPQVEFDGGMSLDQMMNLRDTADNSASLEEYFKTS